MFLWMAAVHFCNSTKTPHQGFCLMTAATFYNSTIRVRIKVLMMTADTFCSSTCSSHQGSGWMINATFCVKL
jgi:hypothetical protein